MIGAAIIRSTLIFFLLGSGYEAWMTTPASGEVAKIRYVGSSTVAIFLREADPIYKSADFEIDTLPESEGGERAILEGTTDLAGIARLPHTETLRAGIASSLIGRDAIAVVVNSENRLRSLGLSELRDIFTGQLHNWKELGGDDRPIQPFIVGPESATRRVFRTVVLGSKAYAGCREVKPDRAMVDRVAENPGAIGQISFSFLNGSTHLRAVAIEGQEPSVTNFDYPIARPLYLLWRDGNSQVESFVQWTQTAEGQRVVMQHFVGVRVVGSAGAAQGRVQAGTLIVYTETYPVYDGGIYYYPHKPYVVLTRYGEFVRRVPNHRGQNDESPMRIQLPAGTYLIRPESSRSQGAEFFVKIERGKTTQLNAMRKPK